MARIRSIKPDFFEDEKISELSLLARYLYVGMWCWMDKGGICEDSAKLIKSRIVPHDDSITVKKIQSALIELVNAGRLIQFEFSGKALLLCPKFLKHQHPHIKEEPKYLVPEEIIKSLVQAPYKHVASPSVNGLLLTITVNDNGITSTPGLDRFDFEFLYQKYPRREGKANGFTKCNAQIKTQDDYMALGRAIEKYKSLCSKNGTDTKHIKLFSTFMECWRDYLDPDVGTSTIAAPRELSFSERYAKGLA